jgi:hypothetical protein
MKKEIAVTVILLSLLIGDLSLLAWPSIFAAQSSDRKPPKKEKFGSSLKRLKWDPNKQAAVESEQDDQKRSREIGPGDVIKVETNLVVMAGCGKCRLRRPAILNTSCTVDEAIILRRVKRRLADVPILYSECGASIRNQ